MAWLPAGRAQAALVGSISGVVTTAGEPVAYAWVSIIPVTAEGLWAGRGVVTSTDAQGSYRVADVYTDFVKVQVRGPGGLATTYWPDAYTFGNARPLRVTSAGARADVELPRGGSVSGEVVDARTGEPVAGARVSAQAVSGIMWEQVGTPALGAATGPGSFAIADLPPVPVALWVVAPAGSRHLSQWFDDAALIDQARWVDGAAATTGLQVRLREGAELTGTVRDDTGAPVPGATVSVLGCPGLCQSVARTDDEGLFRFAALVPGRGMRLRAEAEEAGYVSPWYLDQAAGEAPIDLVAGQRLSGVDLVLTRGAYVGVRVVDERTGSPVPGVSADLRSVGEPMLTFPSHARPRDAAGAGGREPGLEEPSPGGVLGILPTVAPDPAGAVPSDAAGEETGEPDHDALEIGPVPPGEYQLLLYPGPRNAAYLPVVWGSVDAVGLDGRIRLGPGQRVAATVGLVRGAGSPGQPGAQGPSCPSTTVGWPGLWAGFLDPPPAWGG